MTGPPRSSGVGRSWLWAAREATGARLIDHYTLLALRDSRVIDVLLTGRVCRREPLNKPSALRPGGPAQVAGEYACGDGGAQQPGRWVEQPYHAQELLGEHTIVPGRA